MEVEIYMRRLWFVQSIMGNNFTMKDYIIALLIIIVIGVIGCVILKDK